MLKINLTIDTANAAFEDFLVRECSRIVHEMAHKMTQYNEEQLNDAVIPLFDANGNKVGRAFLNLEREEPEEMPVFNRFVAMLSEEDLREALETLCGIETYKHETWQILAETLLLCLRQGDITMLDVHSYFHPKYPLPE